MATLDRGLIRCATSSRKHSYKDQNDTNQVDL